MNKFLELTKPRITFFILMSTAIGFMFGSRLGNPWTWLQLLHTLIGTMLITTTETTYKRDGKVVAISRGTGINY